MFLYKCGHTPVGIYYPNGDTLRASCFYTSVDTLDRLFIVQTIEDTLHP